MEKKEDVRFLRSTRGRIIIAVLIVIICIITALNFATLTRFDKTITLTTKNYMQDLAYAYGHSIDAEINGGMSTDKALTAGNLSNELKGVGVKGMKSSYAYLVDAKGTMIYHPSADKIGQPVENSVVKDLVSKIEAGETIQEKNETVEYNFNGVKKYAAFYVSDKQQFILVISADDAEAKQAVNSTIVSSTVIGVTIGLIGIIILALLLVVAMRPIRELSRFVDKMSDLDFSPDQDSRKLAARQDEFGIMARSIINLQKRLIEVISNIKDQSSKLFDSSNGMYKHATDMNETTNQVDTAVNEIAQGATSQASQTQSASENVITIGNMIEEANQKVDELYSTAQKIKDSNKSALDILGQLGATNEKTKESINQIEEQTRTTNQSAGKIREATSIIANIADETNLLSLNASIEAARAGEAGRGFAVVASQIQQLADQSSESAQQIEQIVEELMKDSDQAVSTMDSVKEIIEQQSENVDQTKEAFGQVSAGIDESIAAVTTITGKMNKMDEARKKVVETVSSLSAIAQENAASTEESSASVSSITSIADEIEESSGDLKDIAKLLDEDMNKFKY